MTLLSRNDVQPNGLPSVESPNFLPKVKQILEIREGQTRNESQRFVTMADLEAIGITQSTIDRKINITAGVQTGGTPPGPPKNLVIINNILSHTLSWENPKDSDLSHIEVWQSIDTQDRTAAEVVTIATKPTETVTISGCSTRHNYYYWIRAVDYSGNYSSWCPSNQMGGELVKGQFAESINNLLTTLFDDTRYNDVHTIVADSFQIIEPSIGLTTGKKVFATGNIGGMPTVGISGDLIVDGTVLTRMIDSEAITAAKMSTTDLYTLRLQSTNYSPGTVGYKIDALTGQAEFNSIKFRFTSGASIPSEIDNSVIQTQLNDQAAATTAAINQATIDMNNRLDGVITDWNTTTIDGGRISTGSLNSNAVGTNLLVAHSANIKSGTINDAHINNLSATKITAGQLQAGVIATRALSADTLAAGNALIGHTIQSQLYSPGSIGWQINKDGTFYFNGGGGKSFSFNGSTFAFNGTISASSVTGLGPLATASSVTNSMVTSIDGAKITTGFISASRINTNTISTIMINGEAVTKTSASSCASVEGNGNFRDAVSAYISNGPVSANVLIIFTCRVGYTSGAKKTGLRLKRNGSTIASSGYTDSINDYQTLSFKNSISANSSNTYTIEFYGIDNTVYIHSGHLYVMGVMR